MALAKGGISEVSVPVGDERPTGGDIFVPVVKEVEAGPAPTESGLWANRKGGKI